MNRLHLTAALIVLLSGALLLWSSGRSLAADAVDFAGTSSTHSTSSVGGICPDKYAFVTSLRTTGTDQLTNVAFSCVETLQDASWDPAGPQIVAFDQVPGSSGVTTNSQCPTGLYAVGFDFSLVERTEQNAGPLGPTLHIMAPAHLRLICSNPRAPQYGNTVLQDRRTCPVGQAVTGLYYKKSDGKAWAPWGMYCSPFLTPISPASFTDRVNPGRRLGVDQAVPTIRVVSGTYGAICGQSEGNVTAHLAGACDGKSVCEYSVDYSVIGDPAPGCAKDYTAKWLCNGVPRKQPHVAHAAAEAGYGSKLTLTCEAN